MFGALLVQSGIVFAGGVSGYCYRCLCAVIAEAGIGCPGPEVKVPLALPNGSGAEESVLPPPACGS
eukprot:1990547-Lingulodinium_polyedra.AAC.1